MFKYKMLLIALAVTTFSCTKESVQNELNEEPLETITIESDKKTTEICNKFGAFLLFDGFTTAQPCLYYYFFKDNAASSYVETYAKPAGAPSVLIGYPNAVTPCSNNFTKDCSVLSAGDTYQYVPSYTYYNNPSIGLFNPSSVYTIDAPDCDCTQ